MKLNSKLIEILELMNSGWQLGNSGACMRGWWLQKGGCGKGGETKYLHGRTNVYELWTKKLIVSDGYNFPIEKYHLTEKGKKYIEQFNKN